MNDEKPIESRICPGCKKPFLWTHKVIKDGWMTWHVVSGSYCLDCQGKLRDGILHGDGDFRPKWDDR